MYPPIHLRRSVLYVPGANQRALEKANSLSADALIFDLEDSIDPAAKVVARQQACAVASSGLYGRRELIIRINGANTAWHEDDLQAAAGAKPAAILLPKANSAADVEQLEANLDRIGADSSIQIWAMIETPQGVLDAAEIARSSARLTVLVMGTNDLSMELRSGEVSDRQPLLFALSACLLAARAAGKAILDGVYNDVANQIGFEAECRQSRSLGFDGKTLIHPNQIEICNRVFTPDAEQIERARKIIEAMESAQSEGKGVATFEGRLIENLHVEAARRLLAIGEAIALREQSSG